MLIMPKMVILDSATLGKVSHDYWNQDAVLRGKARTFIANLNHFGIHITLTLTHISELFRHENEEVVRERLKFLRDISLIAWLRPYNREWFPADIPDLLCREIHAVIYGSAQGWKQIIDKVRPDLWETGMGHEMFVEDDTFWTAIMKECRYQHEIEKYTASMDRADPEKIKNIKFRELQNWQVRPKEERIAYIQSFAKKMQKQLDCHGDKRLNCSNDIANNFAIKTLQNIKAIDERGKNIKQEIFKHPDIPKEFVTPEMTAGEFGELAVYAKRLKMVSETLHPWVELTMQDIPPDALPSYVLERKLASIQRNAKRVSGSDMGDRRIASLIFYADSIEVDKRTCHYLNQIRNKCPKIGCLMKYYFSSSDYSQIPNFFEKSLL